MNNIKNSKKKKNKNKVKLVLLALVLATACQSTNLKTVGLPKAPTKGPKEYINGWTSGCQTGMTAYTNNYYRASYKVQVDPKMMRHPYYQKGWEVGQSYCSYYMSTYLANKEFFSNDLRSENTWFKLKGDGMFSYKNITKFNASTEDDIPLFSGRKESLLEGNGTFFN